MPMLLRRAGDHQHRGRIVRSVQVDRLDLRDLQELRLRDRPDLVAVRHSTEPFASPAAFLRRTDAGGVLVMKQNVLSW